MKKRFPSATSMKSLSLMGWEVVVSLIGFQKCPIAHRFKKGARKAKQKQKRKLTTIHILELSLHSACRYDLKPQGMTNISVECNHFLLLTPTFPVSWTKSFLFSTIIDTALYFRQKAYNVRKDLGSPGQIFP